MSLMLMMVALLSAVVFLGGGSYVLRGVLARMESRHAWAEPEPPPRAGPREDVGGYVPAQRDPDELPADLRARAGNLVALGRTDEAVHLVTPHLGGDEARARRAVGRLRAGGRPALEP
ncbi:hypothetical protein [Nocardiopsis sp. MG754419]|uniref:hypothetical protein n=1 Tax=Nocardiopsis sp. MG754419 TaxID=2259865 RepID=UPI001BA6AF9E|nr:hypothetical protein [Nocardiopsis sp. MG754419]MBR8745035.1 hypothetical protein [Nocardiopsis sp. MG754419]